MSSNVKTIPPTAAEKRAQDEFLYMLRTQGEKEARVQHFQKQVPKGSKPGESHFALWAAIMGLGAGVLFFWRRKPPSPTGDAILDAGHSMGLHHQ